VSTTDPDAALMRPCGERACLGYHDHCVVDGGKARIILHALVTPADIMENTPMLDQLRRVIFRWRVKPTRIIADTTYATIDNIRALEGEEGIRAYVPLPDWEHQRAYLGPSHFTYDGEHDVYICPEGTPLHPYRRELKAEKVEYRAAATLCNACPRKAECTPSDQGRAVIAPSMPSIWTGCAVTMRRRSTRKRCASGRSGSSRSSGRRSSGMGCGSSVYGG
jgi:hypothetical protein